MGFNHKYYYIHLGQLQLSAGEEVVAPHGKPGGGVPPWTPQESMLDGDET